MTLDDAPDVLTVPEAARLLRIGRNQAYEMVQRGEIYAARCGRSLRVPKVALLRLLGVDPPEQRDAALAGAARGPLAAGEGLRGEV